jgi:hypothetical protein
MQRFWILIGLDPEEVPLRCSAIDRSADRGEREKKCLASFRIRL